MSTVLALLIAGCGDSGASGDDAQGITVQTGSLAKSEFVKQADTVCEKERTRFERMFKSYLGSIEGKSSPLSRVSQAEELVETVFIPPYAKQIDRISSLGAPEADAEKVAAFLNAEQQGLDEAKAEPVKFVSENGTNGFHKAAKLAEAYGLTVCAGVLG